MEFTFKKLKRLEIKKRKSSMVFNLDSSLWKLTER